MQPLTDAINYTTQQREAGVSDKHIRARLLRRGLEAALADAILAGKPVLPEDVAGTGSSFRLLAHTESSTLNTLVRHYRQHGYGDEAIITELCQKGWRLDAAAAIVAQFPAGLSPEPKLQFSTSRAPRQAVPSSALHQGIAKKTSAAPAAPESTPDTSPAKPFVRAHGGKAPTVHEQPFCAVLPEHIPRPSMVDRVESWVHDRTLLPRIIGTGVAVLLLAVVAGKFLPQAAPAPTEAAAITLSPKVNDQNYTFTLPVGWQASSDNHSGAGVNVFYQPGDPAQRKGTMTVFVTPSQTGNSAKHVKQQIAALQQNGGTATVQSDDRIMLPSTMGELQIIRSTAASDRTDITYYAYLAVDFGDTSYNVDAMIPGTVWQHNKDQVVSSLKTFAPKNKSVTHVQ